MTALISRLWWYARGLREAGRVGRGAVVALLLVVCAVEARAAVALLVEDPFGRFGEMNPTGHAAIYFDHICAESPTRLRACGPGETGAVLSRYHHVGGYDWLAVPVLPYLYAVDELNAVPLSMTPEGEVELREAYRREHLRELAPDRADGGVPEGEWVQLVGAAYDRDIHGFAVTTTEAQDAALIRRFNRSRNLSHFNLFFHNCADFSRQILDFYYPHSVRRSFLADFGFTTPKHLAKNLTHYGRRHAEAGLQAFLIPQVAGTVERSRRIKGVEESLLTSKKYLVPLLFFYPEFTGGMAVAYLSRGRYTMPADAMQVSPADFVETGQVGSGAKAGDHEAQTEAAPRTAHDGETGASAGML